MKKKENIIVVFLLIYMVLGCSYVFFSDCKLNQVLSTKFGFAQLYSFSTLIGFMVIIYSLSMIVISIFRSGFKLKIDVANLILVLTVLLSVSFIIWGVDNKKT